MTNNNLRIATYKDLLLVDSIESSERMVNISVELEDCICIYQQDDMLPYVGHDLWVREGVAIRLKMIIKKLKLINPDYRLKIVYGFRHPEIQSFYFNRRKNNLRKINLDMSEDELNELTNTMTAYPETAGHPTGGAVDVTITTEYGDLDMGTGISDFSDPEKVKTYCDYLTPDQKNNRKLLHDLIVGASFAPYYGEWWHFSYGDKEWAWFYKEPNAIYKQINFRTV